VVTSEDGLKVVTLKVPTFKVPVTVELALWIMALPETYRAVVVAFVVVELVKVELVPVRLETFNKVELDTEVSPPSNLAKPPKAEVELAFKVPVTFKFWVKVEEAEEMRP
jgi:hypothetical protein